MIEYGWITALTTFACDPLPSVKALMDYFATLRDPLPPGGSLTGPLVSRRQKMVSHFFKDNRLGLMRIRINSHGRNAHP